MTNDQLRVQLAERGFANLPVTQTTRKVLIKRLQNAANGTGAKDKSRRETIFAVAKYSSAEESDDTQAAKSKKKVEPSKNRRATIGIPSVVVAPKEIPKPARRTSRPPESAPPAPVAEPPKTTIINERSDDDEIPAPINRRTSRSPSLTKSHTVTTSYKQVIAPVQEDDDVILVYDDDEDSDVNDKENDPVQPKPSQTTKSSSYQSQLSSISKRQTLASNDHRSASPKIYSQDFESVIRPSNTATNSAYKRRYTTNTAAVTHELDDPVLSTAPFLSDFTRRLAELKAEPLVDSEPRAVTSTYRQRSEFYQRSATAASQQAAHKEAANASFLKTLEQKLRWPLLILLIIVAVVFVYVFFISD